MPDGLSTSASGSPAWQDEAVSRVQKPSGLLEGRLFHKVLVASNKPADWPPWLIAAVALLPTIAVAGLWWVAAGGMGALIVAVIQVLFTASDALVLVNLPRSRISFGPVGPQLFILEMPRLVIAAVAVVLVVWAGMMPALIAVVVINAGASLAPSRRLAISTASRGSGALSVVLRVTPLRPWWIASTTRWSPSSPTHPRPMT